MIKLKDPFGRKTEPNLKKFIDALVRETKPPEDLKKICAVLIMLIEFSEHSKTMDKQDKRAMEKLVKKFHSEAEKTVRQVKQLQDILKNQKISDILDFQKTISVPDRVNFLAASIMSLKQAGSDGERKYTELTKDLDKMYKEIDELFFQASGKHLFEGLWSAIKAGSTAVLKTLWTVAKTILGPVLKLGLAIIKALWSLISPIISFFETVFEKSRIGKLPSILAPAGTALAICGFTAVSGVAIQVSAGVFLAQCLFNVNKFATMADEFSSFMNEADMISIEDDEV
jgi:hypothetical protein